MFFKCHDNRSKFTLIENFLGLEQKTLRRSRREVIKKFILFDPLISGEFMNVQRIEWPLVILLTALDLLGIRMILNCPRESHKFDFIAYFLH